jgi:beta-phosphoglucomutase
MPAVLWDLDGTLVDSAEQHFESWAEALAAEGRSLTREQFQASFGLRNDRILAGWLGADAPSELALRIADAKEIAYRRLVRAHGVEVLPGASKWVTHLHALGWKQAIASSAPRANVEAVLDVLGWTRDFDAIAASEDVHEGKPNPAVFLAAAARVGVEPARCIVVEDAAAGVEAARRGGMRSIGIGAGAATARPDVAVPSLDALTAADWEALSICR